MVASAATRRRVLTKIVEERPPPAPGGTSVALYGNDSGQRTAPEPGPGWEVSAAADADTWGPGGTVGAGLESMYRPEPLERSQGSGPGVLEPRLDLGAQVGEARIMQIHDALGPGRQPQPRVQSA